MKKFLVCKNEDTKNKLLENGFKLLKEEDGVFIFLNNEDKKSFDFSKLEITQTNRLNF